MSWEAPLRCADMFVSSPLICFNKKGRTIWNFSILGLCLAPWLERNKRILEDLICSESEHREQVIWVAIWSFEDKDFCHFKMSDRLLFSFCFSWRTSRPPALLLVFFVVYFVIVLMKFCFFIYVKRFTTNVNP